MFQPSRILVPIDFTDESAGAFLWAERMALRFGGEMIVVFADPGISWAQPFCADFTQWTDIRDETIAAAQRRLEAFAGQRISSAIPYRTRVEIEAPIGGILRAIVEENADLVVMTTHGRTGWRRLLLGSVAESVLHETTVPVLSGRAAGPRTLSNVFQRIVCPVNFSDVTRRALEHAASVAEAFGSELIVVSVVADGDGEAMGRWEELRKWIPVQWRERSFLEELVLRGDAAEQILDFSERMEADLVVLGSQQKLFHDETVIGSTTERVIRHARCPVLTVSVGPLEASTPMEEELADKVVH